LNPSPSANEGDVPTETLLFFIISENLNFHNI